MTKFRTIWPTEDNFVEVIDQRKLPHEFVTEKLTTYKDAEIAIKEMTVRGAPLIGATAAYGIYLAVREMVEKQLDGSFLDQAFSDLRASRPTAVNLFWALDKMRNALDNAEDFLTTAWEAAAAIVEEDVETCRLIGVHGLPLIETIAERKKGDVVNILTHCNAGMLGCVEWGTITSPIYQAIQKGVKVHVWVDETRPRNQGSNLTAYELTRHNVPHTLIVDNAGGHLMQHGMVDMVIVGTDRTTRQGDVPIEERNQDEVRYMIGKSTNGTIESVLICPETTPASNYGFDVTPARLVTKIITERGVCDASEEGLLSLFPEYQ